MDEITLTLNSPITDEQWDAITDVDFDNTDEIHFHTKHGKEVYFVKRKKGKWTLLPNGDAICQECKHVQKSAWDMDGWDNFCHHCGADMREEGEKI